jgi:hypothetical protein
MSQHEKDPPHALMAGSATVSALEALNGKTLLYVSNRLAPLRA